MTQKTKLDLLEKKFEKTRPYRKPNRGLFRIGLTVLLHLWRVIKILELIKAEGAFTDLAWVEKAKPSQEELLEIAMMANMVENTEILWDQVEE